MQHQRPAHCPYSRWGAAGLLIASSTAAALAEPAVAPRPANAAVTALDEYVAAADPAYGWELVSKKPFPGGAELAVLLTSQSWRRVGEVSHTDWRHSLAICVPDGADPKTALLLIGGGVTANGRPDGPSDRARSAALATRSVVAELSAVPNQPLEIDGDGSGRVEDGLLAKSWNMYLQTRDPTWIAQLPMAKSAVRAMDAVQEVLQQESPETPVERFTVAGGSKRGWTTWLTAAVDPRVAAIAPIVIDVLNIDASMRHHHAAYGDWSPALRDYEEQGLADLFLKDEGQAILKLVDPYEYRDRFTMPKCLINASGDEFFLPDSSRFYFDDLPGEKHLCYVPNAGHSLEGSNALDTLAAFHHSVVHDTQRPTLEWEFDEHGGLIVESSAEPNRVTLWQAHNPDARDFRLPVIGQAYRPRELKPSGARRYATRLSTPDGGWQASFVQAEFDIGAPTPFRVTTPVWVMPDVLPHAEGN